MILSLTEHDTDHTVLVNTEAVAKVEYISINRYVGTEGSLITFIGGVTPIIVTVTPEQIEMIMNDPDRYSEVVGS